MAHTEPAAEFKQISRRFNSILYIAADLVPRDLGTVIFGFDPRSHGFIRRIHGYKRKSLRRKLRTDLTKIAEMRNEPALQSISFYTAPNLLNGVLLDIQAVHRALIGISEPQKRNDPAARTHIHCRIVILRSCEIRKQKRVRAESMLRAHFYIDSIGKPF